MSPAPPSTAPLLVSVGELLWDLLPSGPQLGGAPANVACHAAALGARAAVISRVGNDPLGRRAMEILASRGLDVQAIDVLPGAPTGTVHVEVDASGHPTFDIVRDVAWDQLAATTAAMSTISAADAVCFGTLAQRTPSGMAAVSAMVDSARPNALRVLDINLRAPFHSPEVIKASLERADVLKLNDDELPILARQLGLTGSPPDVVGRLASMFGMDAVALTMGARGAGLWIDGLWFAQPAVAVQVVDSVGAGDAFTAALILGLLGGLPPEDVLRRAVEVAAFVCTQPGATPLLPERLKGFPKNFRKHW